MPKAFFFSKTLQICHFQCIQHKMIQIFFFEILTIGSCTILVWEYVAEIWYVWQHGLKYMSILKWDINSFGGHTKHLQQTSATFFSNFLHYGPWFCFFNLKRIMLGTCTPNFRSKWGVEYVLNNGTMWWI